MKHFFKLFLLIFFVGFVAQAQDFITHKVKDNDSVKELAKTYGVSIFQILNLNPDAKKELKTGSVLIIPNVKTTRETEIVNNTVVADPIVSKVPGLKDVDKTPETLNNSIRSDSSEIISSSKTYIVKKSEGKWRIAQNHGITVEELEKRNPQIIEGLKEGDTLKIPIKTYQVLPSEGFFRVKLKTGLTQQQLEDLNPGLSRTGLKPGMILNLGNIGEQNPQVYAITNQTAAVNLLPSLHVDKQKKIAILLPFKLKSIELDSVSDTKKRLQNDKLLNISLDFYSGVEIALDSLRKLNIPLEVKVYDTSNRESNSMTIANELLVNSTNAVIGPLLPKNFNTVASKLAYESIPMFSPLTKKVKLRNNVFQSRPSEDLLFQRIVNYVKKDSSVHIVILHDSKNVKRAKELKVRFPEAEILASKLDKDGKEQFYIYEVTLAKKLKPGNNVVFLETQAEGFVSNVSSVLNSKNNLPHMNITLATTNMNEAFEGDHVSNNQLSNLQFMYPAMAKIAFEESNKYFVKMYKELYNESPSSYAVRGFDLTMDVVFRLLSATDIYDVERNKMLTEYLQNKFMYMKSSQGGFVNHASYLVKYKDLNIVEIKD